MIRHCLLVLGSIWLASCSTPTGEKTETEETQDTVHAAIRVDYMDTTVGPGEDFYQYCNGSWIKNNPVPSTESRWGSFNELDKLNKKRIGTILERVSTADNKKGTPAQLVGDYYVSYMDSTRRDSLGYQPIKPMLDRIENYEGNDYTDLAIELSNKGVSHFINYYVYIDAKNSTRYISYLSQSGLGLPNKDYYEQDRFSDIREKYRNHIARMIKMTGTDSAESEKKAEDIYKFEESLAHYSMSPIEMRNPMARYNPYSKEGLNSEASHMRWNDYFEGIGAKSFDSLIVSQPEFLNGMDSLIAATPERTIKDFLRWKVVDEYASKLSSDFVQANFDFYGTVLNGTEKMKPADERIADELTGGIVISESLGRIYVDEHFSAEAKAEVNKMVDHLFAAYETRLNELDWMSDSTKTKAFEKLNSFNRKLGYPDKWTDFSSLEISHDDYVGNVIACHNFEQRDNYTKLGEPIDKDDWGMPPHMINAYYNPMLNEIVFPAGIMQPPFFDKDAEDAVNYGRMGMIIGHEITHGFDDQGSQYDADGNLKNWWNSEDRKKFEKQASLLGNTYGNFCPFENTCVQPQLTMGENIADLGGATMAYHAYKLTDEFKSGKEKYGMDPAERFFVAMGQIWKNNYRDEALKNRIASDPHSPAKFRVNGPVMHMPEFHAAFETSVADSMALEEEKMARIW